MYIIDTICKLAQEQVGTREIGNNLTTYGELYGWNGVPWCVIFLWWIFHQAKRPELFYAGGRTASCSELLRWAEAAGLTVPISQGVQRGDLLLFNFSMGMSPEHCGLAVSDTQPGSLAVATVEGNTSSGSSGSQSEGGCVAIKTRYPYQIVAVIRPAYEPETDYDGRWSAGVIREALDDGALAGYPDGLFRPDRAVTREELAQFWHNIKEALRRGLDDI